MDFSPVFVMEYAKLSDNPHGAYVTGMVVGESLERDQRLIWLLPDGSINIALVQGIFDAKIGLSKKTAHEGDYITVFLPNTSAKHLEGANTFAKLP